MHIRQNQSRSNHFIPSMIPGRALVDRAPLSIFFLIEEIIVKSIEKFNLYTLLIFAIRVRNHSRQSRMRRMPYKASSAYFVSTFSVGERDVPWQPSVGNQTW